MKKIVALLLCAIGISLLCACDFNAPLRNKMLNYYSQDGNYIEISGIIQNKEHLEDIDELRVEVEIITENHPFPYLGNINRGEFTVVNWSSCEFDVEVNDAIIFVSAPFYFYNGHIWPIVEIKKDGQEYLSFHEGKNNYLKWINDTFD